MELKNQWGAKGGWSHRLLQWVNLRPEEGERTLLMFTFYTATSVGLLWLEASAVGLFLDSYGAASLPLIYMAGAAIGSGLGFLYSWLQTILPLRRVIVAIALLMAAPLFLFRIGLDIAYLTAITIFIMRLWLEAVYVLNDLNTSITANQLFNIREIKRTYPIISSGILVADVVSGFSLPLLINWVGLNNVTIIASIMMAVGAGVLFYLSKTYSQAFPDSTKRLAEEHQPDFTNRRWASTVKRYVLPLFAFFILAQVLYILVDFQFLSALEQQNATGGGQQVASGIASFLGLFNGILGICELVLQWFASSRVIERIGVFVAVMLLPALVSLVGAFSLTGALIDPQFQLFLGLVGLKFIDELLHYTLIEGTGPVLFQPIPDPSRSHIQARVNGVAEPLCMGLTGVGIWATIQVCQWLLPDASEATLQQLESWVFIAVIILVALLWLFVTWLLRSGYVGLLVSSAQRGRLGVSDVDMRAFKKAVVETLEEPGTEADKRSCIELLSQIDPENVGEVLAPLLEHLSASLQRQSLEIMLQHPSPTHLDWVRSLMEKPSPPEVTALALRYIWLNESDSDTQMLRPYLRPEVDPVVRGTAASLIMRRGNREQKAEATNALRRMLTHKQERERVMGCRALGEADYLQGLRLYIPNLLQDESLRVRCALLEVIASTHLEEYYPSLLRGLYYKSTREAALRSLVRLDNEVIEPLVLLGEDIHKPDLVRMYAWSAIGQIGTPEALNALVGHLMTSWGINRRNILRILLKMPQDAGIEGVLDRLGRSGVETLIDQELMFMGQLYSALIDLSGVSGVAPRTRDNGVLSADYAELLRRSLRDLLVDATERLFLLMKFLYPLGAITAAAFNLKSGFQSNMARGLEILDNTLDIPTKRVLLSVLDGRPDREKLQNLSELVPYESMSPSDRTRQLLELRHFLSDWPLACCFHLARVSQWGLSADQTLAGLRHPRGFVREAVLAYLRVASPKALAELLPMMKNDPDRLVAAQVKQLMTDMGLLHSSASATPGETNGAAGYPGVAGTSGS